MKTDFDAKLSSLLTKITSDDAKHLVNGNELKKLKKIWYGLLHRKKIISWGWCTKLLNISTNVRVFYVK